MAQLIKFVMTSSTEAELGALYITAQKMVTMRQTIFEMVWPQPPTPIQTDNTKAEGVVKNTIVAKNGRLWTYGHTGYAVVRHKNNLVFTDTKYSTTAVTITGNNTH